MYNVLHELNNLQSSATFPQSIERNTERITI